MLVNNAGIIKRIPMIEMTAAEFRQVIDVDLNAPFIVVEGRHPRSMIEKGKRQDHQHLLHDVASWAARPSPPTPLPRAD